MFIDHIYFAGKEAVGKKLQFLSFFTFSVYKGGNEKSYKWTILHFNLLLYRGVKYV